MSACYLWIPGTIVRHIESLSSQRRVESTLISPQVIVQSHSFGVDDGIFNAFGHRLVRGFPTTSLGHLGGMRLGLLLLGDLGLCHWHGMVRPRGNHRPCLLKESPSAQYVQAINFQATERDGFLTDAPSTLIRRVARSLGLLSRAILMMVLSLHCVLRRAESIVKTVVAAGCAEANVGKTVVRWSDGVDGGGGVVGR